MMIIIIIIIIIIINTWCVDIDCLIEFNFSIYSWLCCSIRAIFSY